MKSDALTEAQKIELFRGQFLQRFIEIEGIIEKTITDFFYMPVPTQERLKKQPNAFGDSEYSSSIKEANRNTFRFFSHFFFVGENRITTAMKIETFKHVFKLISPSHYMIFDTKKVDGDNLFSTLFLLNEIRNKIAHEEIFIQNEKTFRKVPKTDQIYREEIKGYKFYTNRFKYELFPNINKENRDDIIKQTEDISLILRMLNSALFGYNYSLKTGVIIKDKYDFFMLAEGGVNKLLKQKDKGIFLFKYTNKTIMNKLKQKEAEMEKEKKNKIQREKRNVEPKK